MPERSAESPAAQSVAADSRPLLAVMRGEPTAAELAALTVVVDALMRRRGERPPPDRPTSSRWAARQQLMRQQLRPGPGAWRASALPH